MTDDLYRQLETRLVQLIQEFNEYRNTNPLERASVRQGQLRFIGGKLLIDSGGRLEIIGVLDGNGNFEWSGPWRFDSGDGEIAGDVDLTGNFDLTGKLTAGNVRIEGGKIYVGAGASQIVIDGASGKILAGGMEVDPSGGGQVSFPGGAVVKAGPGGGVSMIQGNYAAVVTAIGASIGKIGLSVSATDTNGISFAGVPSGSPGPQYPQGTYYENSLGQLRKASGS